MNKRWVLAGSAVGLAGVLAFVLTRSSEHDTTRAAASRKAKIDVATGRPIDQTQVATAEPVKMVMTESGLRPMRGHEPRVWVDPRNGAINREIVDAVPDPAAAAKQEIEYRKSRLRLTLTEQADACYNGADSHEEIELEYTLVVKNENVRTENVRVKRSSISNPTVERCIIDAAHDVSSFAENVPDMREEQGLIMSLHDIYTANRKHERLESDKSTDPKTPIDR
jgi:hypothetical protein